MSPTAESGLFPFEFFLVATPVSLQGRAASKDRWKKEIREVAGQRIAETVDLVYLQDEPLALTIYYFPTAPMDGDIDNIIKPIMDALVGVIYRDDRTVERVTAQKFEPGEFREFSEPSLLLTAALDATSVSDYSVPVVYVQVENDLSWRRR